MIIFLLKAFTKKNKRGEKMEEEFEKLIKLTEPLRNYISEKYDMKVSILVNCDEVKVIRDEAGVPIKKED